MDISHCSTMKTTANNTRTLPEHYQNTTRTLPEHFVSCNGPSGLFLLIFCNKFETLWLYQSVLPEHHRNTTANNTKQDAREPSAQFFSERATCTRTLSELYITKLLVKPVLD